MEVSDFLVGDDAVSAQDGFGLASDTDQDTAANTDQDMFGYTTGDTSADETLVESRTDYSETEVSSSWKGSVSATVANDFECAADTNLDLVPSSEVESDQTGGKSALGALSSPDTEPAKSSIFLTDFSSGSDSFSQHYVLRPEGKRARNRTIDLHDLPSLFWEGTVSGGKSQCIIPW